MSKDADAAVGRYQVVPLGKGEAVLLDTATGASWSLARDVETFRLGWMPLGAQPPEAALPSAPDQSWWLWGHRRPT